jgi:ligand-binding SRPBCC domain-containing protein
MTRVEHEIEINAPVERVYEYYTNPDNIQQAWPNDVVKESESTTGSNSEGSEMKVKGEYMGREEEVRLQVVEKTPNSRLVARQTQGPFQRLESIQEFQGDTNHTRVRHIIDYELPTSGKFANFVTGNQADDRFRSGMKQAAETVKQKLER